jgi:hypothetical protein
MRRSVRKGIKELKKIDSAIQKKKMIDFNQINHFIVRAFSHVPFSIEKRKNTSIGFTFCSVCYFHSRFRLSH